MKAYILKTSLAFCIVCVLLTTAGCKPGAKTEVVAESHLQCSFANYQQTGGATVVDPELGEVKRAMVASYILTCGNPYVDQTCGELQNGHMEGGEFHWASIYECVTIEGGIWRGTCDSILGKSTVCTGDGEGKYKGLQLYTTLDLSGNTMKFLVTRLIEK